MFVSSTSKIAIRILVNVLIGEVVDDLIFYFSKGIYIIQKTFFSVIEGCSKIGTRRIFRISTFFDISEAYFNYIRTV